MAQILTALIAVLLAAAVWYAAGKLRSAGQLDWQKWAPYLDPRDEHFTTLWKFLLGGLQNTLLAAVLAMSISLVVGTFLVVGRVNTPRIVSVPLTGLMELFRGVPVVLAIFFAARGLPEIFAWINTNLAQLHAPLQFADDLSPLWYVVIGLVVYNSVVIAEILRAGLAALPPGQREAGLALGLTRLQTLRMILLPQAFRSMLPALISQLIVTLKDTSLGFIISFEELLRRSQLVTQELDSTSGIHNPIQTYVVIAAIYITLNYAVSRFATYAEHRWSHR